jgi:lysophospholipase L1-like esterase
LTTVALDDIGAYTFRLTANDTALTASDEVTITVIADPPGEALRVMPVGDSITEARDGPDARGLPSWRKWFFDLTEADDRDVDMVGSRSGVADGDNVAVAVPPPPSWGVWDWDHDGHYGWRADEILNGNSAQPAAGDISDWAEDHQPDVFLVHIGTNDLAQGQSVANAIADVQAIIAAIRAERPDAKIAISQIIKNRPKAKYPNLPADIAAFNAQIPGLAAAASTPTSPVIAVDHATGWNVWTDNYDTLHPSVVGQQKMAQKFYGAMVAAGWFDS